MREPLLRKTLYSWSRIFFRIIQALLSAVTNTFTPRPLIIISLVQEEAKIGGVYSADGHIVVRERRGEGGGRRGGRGHHGGGGSRGQSGSSVARPSALAHHGHHHGHHSKHHPHHSRGGRPTAGPETARVRWQDHQEYHHSHRDHYQSRDQLHQSRDQLHQGRDQIHQGRDQLHQGRDQLHQGRDQLHQGRDQPQKSRDPQQKSRDPQQKSRDPQQKSREQPNPSREQQHQSRDPQQKSREHQREHYQTREQLHQQIREIHKEREKRQAAKNAASQDKLDLIPRAKLKHQPSSAQTYPGPPGGRGLRPSASCCEDRPSRIHTIGLAHSHSSRTTAQAQATYQPSYTSPHMGDDLIEGRYEIYGSTKSSYSRDTTYTLLPADSVVENKLAEEFEEDNSSGEEPSAESPDTVMEGPDKAGESGTLPEDEEFEDPGYEKIMLAEEMNKKGEQEEEESTYEVVPKVAQQVMLIKQPVPETIKENEIIIESEQVEFEEINDTPCDSLEKVEEPIVIEPKLIDLSHYDTLVPRPKKETETVKRVEIEEVHKRTSVVETVKAINKRNLRAAQSLELLSNRLFTKRGEEANNNIVTREMVKAKSIDRVHQDIKDHAKIKEKRVTYHASVDTLSKKEFYRSAESAVDQAFMEEQYCYEPESKASSTKQVMRTRSLMSLEEEQGFRGLPRGKITTGPDGTFRIGGRKASSELNLSEESDQGSEGEVAKPPRLVTGEDLRRRKQEIFKERPLKQPDSEKFFKDINGGRTTKEQAIDNLKRYLKENKIGLRDLLINNNIVIIEPYREENDRDISEYSTRCMKEEKCRITGATIKNPGENNKLESNTLPRASKPYQPTVQRHFFYRCFKTNQKYVDDDLPDPDKVKYARELFQRVGKYAAPEDTILMLPIAAKMYKRDPGPRTTPEVRVVDVPIPKKPQQEQARRWTDTGSQSSGVSSDMSEEMREGFSEEEHEHEMQEVRAATFAEAQPVSPEVLKKIRACGTSVTYYGGRMIARSEGPARSPMTMTILDEIRTSHHQRRPSQDYLGVKFRLIKSNSCGSRLELAGTHTKLVRPDIFGGKSLNEELAECTRPRQMENIDDGKSVHGSWRQLIETRKQARTRAHTSTPRYSDIDFEEFQVVE